MIQPFFILGNPRSGTSLIRVVLNNHKNIVVPPECGFMQWLYDEYKNWSIENGSHDSVKNFTKALVKTKKFETWNLDEHEITNYLLKAKPSNYSELCESVYRFYGKKLKSEVQSWGDKNNYYIHHLRLLNKIFPNAKYIHLIRDGRDVASSYIDLTKISVEKKYKPSLPSNIKEIAEEWEENNNKISAFLNEVPENRKICIKFEKFVINPSIVLKKLCLFLNINYDACALNYYKEENRLFGEPAELMEWKKKTLQKPSKDVIGRYKSCLSKREVELFEEKAKKSLIKYDYL